MDSLEGLYIASPYCVVRRGLKASLGTGIRTWTEFAMHLTLYWDFNLIELKVPDVEAYFGVGFSLHVHFHHKQRFYLGVQPVAQQVKLTVRRDKRDAPVVCEVRQSHARVEFKVITINHQILQFDCPRLALFVLVVVYHFVVQTQF